MKNDKIRNIAIIAHVDHGKTSLVNEMLKHGGVFRENQYVADRVMDSGAIERERGITILAKNAAIIFNGVKINIVDTPGHADFGGEVERSLKMVDGVLLVVDAGDGPMPQTRFVLERALELNLKVIVVINKIDKAEARVKEIEDEVLELLMDLNANDEQLYSPFVYCSARYGTSSLNRNQKGTNFIPLLQKIVDHISAPEGDENGAFQMSVSSTENNDYVGRLAIGKIVRGKVKNGDSIVISNYHKEKPDERAKITALFQFEGMKRTPHDTATIGDIVAIAGCENVKIGDTLCGNGVVEALPFVKISEPSVEMGFMVNDSPFAGKEGEYVTSRHLRARLYKEAEKDLSLKVFDTDSTEAFRVCGRGEMHLSILIENMRREGYEFQVSQPKVLYKTINGEKHEPIDELILDIPEKYMGDIMSRMGVRKGELKNMTYHGDRIKMVFLIPSRGLFGYRSQFLTDTKGEGVMSSVHHGYEKYKGDIEHRSMGSLIAFENGESIVYGLFNAQERGFLFIGANVQVYMGMVVGQNPKNEDLVVNVCKKKALTNMRASASDEALRLVPPINFSLEEALEFINEDELLEVTPKSVRIRKKILDHQLRAKAKIQSKLNSWFFYYFNIIIGWRVMSRKDIVKLIKRFLITFLCTVPVFVGLDYLLGNAVKDWLKIFMFVVIGGGVFFLEELIRFKKNKKKDNWFMTQQVARKMPYSLEAEQAVLGCVLISNNVAAEVCSILKEEDFYSLSHKTIYAKMYDLYKGNQPIDYVTLISSLEKAESLGKVGGIEYITTLTNVVPSAANYQHYCDIVLSDSKLRSLIDASQRVIDNAYAGKSFEEVMKDAEKAIFDIGEDRNKGSLEHISHAVEESTKKFEMIYKNKDALRGVKTDFYGLDKLTNGLQKGDLVLLAARPGVGKTSLGMNIVSNAALKYKSVCAVFSLEMPRVQLAQRSICSTAKVSMENALKGQITTDDWRALWEAKKKYDQSQIYVDDSSLIVPSDILTKCRKLKREKGLDLLITYSWWAVATKKMRTDSKR